MGEDFPAGVLRLKPAVPWDEISAMMLTALTPIIFLISFKLGRI